ncbi:MAG TPA: aminoacyl-tRNA hydrolase [Longimicrobiales bacterium]
MKVVCGLGNPGGAYEATRHNVGWWLVDRLAAEWRIGPFRREGAARVAAGRVGAEAVRLLKPMTYMNRSGVALAPLRNLEDFDISRDLLVVVDDVALDVGRFRFRPQGSAGGHNGLKSIEAVLRTRAYARLRIGVGRPPPGVDLADWVLAPFSPEDEERVLSLLDELVTAVGVWLEEGIEAAMNRFNRS